MKNLIVSFIFVLSLFLVSPSLVEARGQGESCLFDYTCDAGFSCDNFKCNYENAPSEGICYQGAKYCGTIDNSRYTCNSGVTQKFYCASDQVCRDGDCISDSSIWDDFFGSDFGSGGVQDVGNSVVSTCKDNDWTFGVEANDYYSPGSVTTTYDGSSGTDWYDTCTNGVVTERYCVNDWIQSKQFACEFGCNDEGTACQREIAQQVGEAVGKTAGGVSKGLVSGLSSSLEGIGDGLTGGAFSGLSGTLKTILYIFIGLIFLIVLIFFLRLMGVF